MKLQKIITYLVMLIGAVGIILWLTMNSTISDIMKESGVSEPKDIPLDVAEPVLTPLYALLIVVFVLVLVVTVISIFNSLATKPGALKKVLIPAIIFIAILVLGYVFATGDNVNLQPFIDKGQNVTEATSRKVGAGLIAFYILIILAIASMAWSGVKKLVN